MDIIRAQGVCFGYAGEPVLRGVDFSVRPGDFAAVVGANGSGKSTLMKLLIRELMPDSGRIAWFGQDINTFKAWHTIGYVPQHNVLMGSAFPATVLEIVRANLFSEIGLMRLPAKRHTEKALAALAAVGMDGYAKRMIGNLSGGQQQRVMLARALAPGPEALLLDEPTTGVDARSCDELYSTISRLNREQGLTVLMITHDLRRVMKHATMAFHLRDRGVTELSRDQMAEYIIKVI